MYHRKWLAKDLGNRRYALVLYDKKGGDGIRVFIDPEKIKKWPEVHSWFFNLKTKKEQNYELLMEQIKQAEGSICGIQKVNVQVNALAKKPSSHSICPVCKESYPIIDGDKCLGCNGNIPYVIL